MNHPQKEVTNVIVTSQMEGATELLPLRSWIQLLPPGPFLPVIELRHYIELVLSNCRTNPAAMPLANLIERGFDDMFDTPRPY
jgi:hypothetical protein